jgi:hypothetical protein
MDRGHFSANAIQNSVRELNPLDNLLEGRPADVNYAFNFGTIETGYTGSTYEGLWVAGVSGGLQNDCRTQYGADADHLQVKRGADGLSRARKLVDASRYYTFFTLDVSDVLDYGALSARPGAAEDHICCARFRFFGVPRPAGLAGPGRTRFQLPIGWVARGARHPDHA